MATRVYIPSNFLSNITPAKGARWTHDGNGVTIPTLRGVATKRNSSEVSLTDSSSAYGSNSVVFMLRVVIGPVIDAHTITSGVDQFQYTFRCNSTTASFRNLSGMCRVFQSDGVTVRGNPYTGAVDGTDMTSGTAASRNVVDTSSATVNVQAGDYYVAEIGFNEDSASAFTTTIIYGDPTANGDLTAASGDTAGAPWIEFTNTFTFSELAGVPNSLMLMGCGT